MQRRKDNKGRVLKDGEVYRKSDGLYMYRWTAKNGKRHTIYDATLEGLREKEEKIQHDLADGIRIPECSLTLNDLFELWRKNKVGLKEHTFANYVYMYNRFVRDEIGMMKLKDIRKSDIRSYYNGIVRNGKMALNTLETIQNVLHQVFAVAVDDEYIRVNPTDGVLTAIKAAHQYETPKRHALTLPQQQAFLNFIKKSADRIVFYKITRKHYRGCCANNRRACKAAVCKICRTVYDLVYCGCYRLKCLSHIRICSRFSCRSSIDFNLYLTVQLGFADSRYYLFICHISTS